MRTLFKLKDKCIDPACKIYHGVYSCGETYTEETVRSVKTRRNKHNIPPEKSNFSKHLSSGIARHCSWSGVKILRRILSHY